MQCKQQIKGIHNIVFLPTSYIYIYYTVGYEGTLDNIELHACGVVSTCISAQYAIGQKKYIKCDSPSTVTVTRQHP